MKSYYRLILGGRHSHAQECFDGGFIGVDFGIDQDLTRRLPEEWRAFNKDFIPIYLKSHPDKSRIAAGLACGTVWTVAKGMKRGDIVLSPDGKGWYHVGEISGEYIYKAGGPLPQRRPVIWRPQTIDRADMSDALKNSAGSIAALSTITAHKEELERLIGGSGQPVLVTNDETIEDPSAFAMEKHLEDFLVENWHQTDLAKDYVIYEEDGERVGQQYATDTGPIDILAISKDKKTLLVVELKKGRASDAVVGQILRYMGYVREELAEPGQTVKGVIIAHENDPRIRRALSMAPNIEFYCYEVRFRLAKS
jgi:restriction system protein